jgi:hypothetical protein
VIWLENFAGYSYIQSAKTSYAVRDDSGGSFLAVTCGNGHIVLAALNYSFWCRIVWDSVVVNLSLWEIVSDLAVTHA